MKKLFILALSFIATTALAKNTTTTTTTTTTKTTNSKSSDVMIMMPSDLKWTTAAGMPEVSMVDVEGNANTNHHSFMKFSAGFNSALHSHTADHFTSVVAGTFLLTVDGVEHKLPAGSYFALKNKKPHMAGCAVGAECIIFTDVRGKWDSLPAKETTMAANTKTKASDVVIMMPSEMKWSAVEGFQGIVTSVVEGDAMKGNHHSFMKFDSKFAAPLHMHSADHYVSVIQGTFLLTVDGVEHRLPAGSFFGFKNKKAHTSGCAEGSQCLIFADVRGKWDVVPQKPSTISSVSSSSDDSSTH